MEELIVVNTDNVCKFNIEIDQAKIFKKSSRKIKEVIILVMFLLVISIATIYKKSRATHPSQQ